MLYGDLKGVWNRTSLEHRPPPPLGTKHGHYIHTPQMLYGDSKGVLKRTSLEHMPRPQPDTKHEDEFLNTPQQTCADINFHITPAVFF